MTAYRNGPVAIEACQLATASETECPFRTLVAACNSLEANGEEIDRHGVKIKAASVEYWRTMEIALTGARAALHAERAEQPRREPSGVVNAAGIRADDKPTPAVRKPDSASHDVVTFGPNAATADGPSDERAVLMCERLRAMNLKACDEAAELIEALSRQPPAPASGEITDRMVQAALNAFNDFPCPLGGSIARTWDEDQMRAALAAAKPGDTE